MTQTLSHSVTRAVPKARRSALAQALADCFALVGRSLLHVVRNPEQLIQTVSLPIILLLLFRYMLGGAIRTDGQTYINYVMPGLILISIGFNLTSTVVGVTDDLRTGIVHRLRSMPTTPQAVLVAHVASAVLRSLVSAAVLVLVGLLVGFRPSADVVGWLGAVGLLLLVTTALAWVAVLLGILAKTVEGANGIGMILVFVPYLSSALVPISTMPEALGTVVENQPVTPAIDTLRALFTGADPGQAAWLAVIWWTGILVLAVPLAGRAFRSRSAR
jgi:ABC-2 type transport system permease protein